jgi:hypothetical protein
MLIVVLIGRVVYLTVTDPPQEVPVEVKEAIAHLLASGHDVERNGVHLYRRGSRYTVLQFGPTMLDVDEDYDEPGPAIDRYFELSEESRNK